MPKIDVAHLNALRLKPKPSDNPPETIRILSDDAADPMEVDRVPMGRTLRKRKEKVSKHLKRGANEKERESFQKRVIMIPLEKPFEETYFTHILWMFFRETRETKEDIRRMFCEAREKMKKRITLKKKKSDPGQFAIPYHLGLQVEPSKESFTFVDCSQRSSGGIVRDLEVQIGNTLVPVDFHVLDIAKLELFSITWENFLVNNRSSVQFTNQPVVPDAHRSSSCHCGAEYETKYSASIESHTATSIDSAQLKSTDTPREESVDSSLEDWENDYYNPTMAANTRHTMHTEENASSVYRTVSTSIDTQPHQTSQKRASTDIAYYPSIDTGVDHVREGDYSIGSWADDHHHESYAVEMTIHEPGAVEIQEDFTYEELLNMQRRDEADQQRAEATRERTRWSHPIDRANRLSIDNSHPSSIDLLPKPKSTKANGANNLFMQQHIVPTTQQRVTTEFYDAAGDIDIHFKHKNQHHTRPKFYWEAKDEYGVYGDDQGCARGMDGHVINVSKDDIRKLMERASRDEHSYICLPEHASSFTQTKLVPEIYTKDEITEMFYGVCGAQEKYEGDFQMKLDGVYYPLNDSISCLTTCMEEMR
ncbi:hypothetical protein F2Q70_00043119 [Brassica cretica]|uniref:Uncharacterized protein n=1 Tax=Brassica cretica TaxID=69181 RepID=A0A8S9KMF8_BRACR|nr:hypothetical protein F2Q70_00043119 [Brassica cretica]